MFILNLKAETKEVQDFYTNHSRAYEHDAGWDLIIPQDVLCQPNSVTFISHRICGEMENLNYLTTEQGRYLSYLLIPRSSISKTPLLMANSVGLIDAGYRGDLKSAVYNTSNEPYLVSSGTRLFQIILPTLEHFDVKFVDELSKTQRGDNAYGSSTKN